MARTRKSIQPLNLYKYDVLLEDKGTRSDYFKVSQFDGYFYGGRNAFLVAGTGVLKPNSRILVEILNKDGATVYSAPVTSFIEGNSRLVQIEIYNDTPIGAGKIVLLGCANTYLDGTPIPVEWQDKYNVRWIADIIISPLIENKTPIRFEKNPSLVVREKFYYLPSASQFTEQIKVPVDIELTPKYYNIFPNGYLAKLVGPANTKYISDYAGGFITGTITLNNTATTETASISIPINKIYNDTLVESQGTLIYTNNNELILGGVISSSGIYTTTIQPFGLVTVSSSLDIQYNRLSVENTGSAISFAKLRLVDIKTRSGEIHKIRVSYKPTTEPGEFVTLGDINTSVVELLSIDSGSKVVTTGKFVNLDVSNYWYSETMSLARTNTATTLPIYYTSSSLSSSYLPIIQSSDILLNSITSTPQIVNNNYINNTSYFIGTKNTNVIELFPRTEYTIKFDAIVSRASGSTTLNQSDYSVEVYLVKEPGLTGKILDTNPRGQLLGILTPTSTYQRQNFENTEFNFTPKINQSGNFGLRFIVYGGFWQIANVSVKPAQEPFFSPDEVDILVPNVNYTDKILTFKAEYLDVNNNSIGLSTLSLPTYFTGSESSTGIGSSISASYALTSSYSIYAQSALSASWAPSAEGVTVAWTSVTGKPAGLVSSSTQINTGSFTGSFTGIHTGSLFGTSSWALSASTATLSNNLSGGATNYIPLWTSATAQSSSNIYQSSGNIVVGTDPGGSELLRVGGSIRASGNSHVVGAASSTTTLNRPDNTGRLDIGGGASTSATVGARAIFQGVDASAGSRGTLSLSAGLIASPTVAEGTIYLQTSGSNRIAILPDGNVGVGTISPSGLLTIYSGSTGGLGGHIVLNNNGLAVANETALIFADGASTTYRAVIATITENAPYYGAIAFRTGIGAYSAITEKMRITGTGNVGIGNTNPDTNLSVIKSSGGLPVSTGTTPTTAITRIKASANNAMFMGMDTASPFGGWIQVSDITGLGTNYPILLNPNGGNVGVGISSPAFPLHARGSGTSGTSTITANSNRSNTNAGIFSMAGYNISSVEKEFGRIYATIDASTAGFEAGSVVIQTLNAGTLSERMRIDTSGSVGIGTTSPSYLLDIRANVAAASTPSITLRLNNQQDSGHRILFANAATTTLAAIDGDIESSGAGTDDGVLKFWTAVNGSMTEKMRIDKNGSVGIGITSPSTQLHLSSSQARITLDSSDDSNAYTSAIILKSNVFRGTGLRFESKTTAPRWFAGIPYANNHTTYQIGYDALNSIPEYAASASLTIVGSSGNVGIGTTGPAHKLDVIGNARIGQNSNSSTTARLDITAGGSGFNSFIDFGFYSTFDAGCWHVGRSGSSGAFYISDYATTGNELNAVTITTARNVGIGTITPATKLDVNGGISIAAGQVISASATYTQLFRRDGNVGIYLGGTGDPNNYYDNTNHYFRDVSGVTTRMIVNSAGNVGIGTTSPASTLTVAGTLSSSGVTQLATAATTATIFNTSPSVLFGTTLNIGNGTNSVSVLLSGASNTGYISLLSGQLRMYGQTGVALALGTNNTERVRIDTSGNVGIGTSTPSASLQVSGTIAAQSIFEKVTVTGSAPPTTLNYNVLEQAILFHSASSTANWTLNFRGNGSTTLNSIMYTGQSLTSTLLVLNTATPYSASVYQIDGTTIIPRWQSGVSGSANNNSLDAHTFTIIKTSATPTYILLGSITKYT